MQGMHIVLGIKENRMNAKFGSGARSGWHSPRLAIRSQVTPMSFLPRGYRRVVAAVFSTSMQLLSTDAYGILDVGQACNSLLSE
jgi:hypothetical protein